MLKDPALVFEKAEETAEKYHARMEAERKARALFDAINFRNPVWHRSP
jgi:hypothetical protein